MLLQIKCYEEFSNNINIMENCKRLTAECQLTILFNISNKIKP